MSLGICCQYMVKKNSKYINLCAEKTLRLGQFNDGAYPDKRIIDTWNSNLQNLFKVLKIVNDQGFKLFRVSSNLFPLYDKKPELLNSNISSMLKTIGDFVKSNNIRITSHPDQFVVLSSNNKNVISNSIEMLKHHAWIFDSMGLDMNSKYSINIHGGVRGNSNVLINSINNLPGNVRKRLTLENDELAYSVNDLYAVHLETKVPLCFDTHHHTFNDAGLSINTGLDLAISTWSGIKPLTHLSNTDPKNVNGSFQEKRKHSEYVHYIPEYQRVLNNTGLIDIEMEFKMKNVAIEDCLNRFEVVK